LSPAAFFRTFVLNHKTKRMKKLLLCSILGISLQASAQYYPMLTDSNVWAVYMDLIPLLQEQHNSSTEFNQQPSIQSFGPGYVNTVKDTVVGAHTYSMFYSRTHDGNLAQWSLMREDTATQQVFILSAGDTAERIIYDYSLNTGDSIWLDFYYTNAMELGDGWYYVDSVNTYMIAAGPRKALYLSNPANPLYQGNQVRFIQWIESVGCNISPVYLDETTPPLMSGIDAYMGPGCDQNTHFFSTTCAWQDSAMTFSSECWENVRNNVSFSYPNGDTCIFILMGSVDDPSMGLTNLTLMPNPANGSSTLHFTGETSNEFAINVTNMLGQTVDVVSPLTWYAKGAHMVQIDLSGYAPGIYSVNLVGAGGRLSAKLIVH
jgi:hypothetical protein